VPLLLLVAPDQASVRVFMAELTDGAPLTFAIDGMAVRDAQSGSEWNFNGCAVVGPDAGQCLKPVEAHQDYWFDWMNHHQGTAVFQN
jgi:hypothetical protein